MTASSITPLPVDFIGFIFYPPSSRYAEPLDSAAILEIPSRIWKVAVFVNESVENIIGIMQKYDFRWIQLHGNESPKQCRSLKDQGCTVIKAFSVTKASDFENTNMYEGSCDYFLFDSRTNQYGGSGMQYDWTILDNYTGRVPFFLSGGIGPEDAERLKQIKHPMLYAVDLNSKLEIEPGRKNTKQLATFIEKINK